MSSTNPADPVKHLAPKEPGAPQPDDHGLSGPPAPEVVNRGYESDVYDSRSVLSVPLLVILFFVLAFGTVTIIFGFIAYPPPDPKAHPGAVKRNDAPLSDRLGRIERGKEVDQPRLEPLVRRSGESRAITRPPLPEGNSPEIHPEELRPTKERYPALYQTGPNQLGLDKAMSLSDEQLKALFPAQKDGTKPPQNVPTVANAGRGAENALVVPPQLPKTPEAKPDGKKDQTDPKDKKDTKDKKDNMPPAPPPNPKGGKQ